LENRFNTDILKPRSTRFFGWKLSRGFPVLIHKTILAKKYPRVILKVQSEASGNQKKYFKSRLKGTMAYEILQNHGNQIL